MYICNTVFQHTLLGTKRYFFPLAITHTSAFCPEWVKRLPQLHHYHHEGLPQSQGT